MAWLGLAVVLVLLLVGLGFAAVAVSGRPTPEPPQVLGADDPTEPRPQVLIEGRAPELTVVLRCTQCPEPVYSTPLDLRLQGPDFDPSDLSRFYGARFAQHLADVHIAPALLEGTGDTEPRGFLGGGEGA